MLYLPMAAPGEAIGKARGQEKIAAPVSKRSRAPLPQDEWGRPEAVCSKMAQNLMIIGCMIN
jgi:hypothetical protein